jgi:hypothetical protein
MFFMRAEPTAEKARLYRSCNAEQVLMLTGRTSNSTVGSRTIGCTLKALDGRRPRQRSTCAILNRRDLLLCDGMSGV